MPKAIMFLAGIFVGILVATAATAMAKTKFVITNSSQIKPGSISLSNINPTAQRALRGPGLELHLVRQVSIASTGPYILGTALCPGEIPLGGGALVEPLPGAPFPPNGTTYVASSGPVYYSNDSRVNGWNALGYNASGQAQRVLTLAMCIKSEVPVRVTGP